ncbi:ATP-binding protein [Streptomyces echinatus]|uniref:ATP-binding protein n=1 Tax=Streptomyces echinatus TaxID=67293 RepID=UPI0037AFD019
MCTARSPLFKTLARATAVRELPASAAAAKMARDDVAVRLQDWGLGALNDAAALVVSELVTNAVRAGGPVRLALCVVLDAGRRVLRIEVADQGPGMPPVTTHRPLPDTAATSGRGLPLIDILARRRGNERCCGVHRVWVHLAT